MGLSRLFAAAAILAGLCLMVSGSLTCLGFLLSGEYIESLRSASLIANYVFVPISIIVLPPAMIVMWQSLQLKKSGRRIIRTIIRVWIATIPIRGMVVFHPWTRFYITGFERKFGLCSSISFGNLLWSIFFLYVCVVLGKYIQIGTGISFENKLNQEFDWLKEQFRIADQLEGRNE